MNKNKKEELDSLKGKMENDESLPLRKGATRLVFGTGNPETSILCIGEGPGYWEDQKGEPFVGNAGKLLDQLLESIDLNRSKVYITNVVHHRPPENRDPTPEEIDVYGTYLDGIIKIIEPKVILTLGRFSMAKFLPDRKISSVHGKIFTVGWGGKNLLVVPMYHPAAALRNPEVMRQEKVDFLNLPRLLQNTKAEVKKNDLDDTKTEQLNLI